MKHSRYYIIAVIAIMLLCCGATAKDNKSGKKAKLAKFGIDVSHHNGLKFWNNIDETGRIKGKIKITCGEKIISFFRENPRLDFVYVKASEGATFQDDLTTSHAKAAKRRGLRVGYYHFYSLSSSPKEQFRNFKRCAKKTSLPPVIDFEHIAEKVKSKKQKKKIYKDLCELDNLMRKEYDKKPIIYCNIRDYEMFLKGEKRFKDRLWMPGKKHMAFINQYRIKIGNTWLDFNYTK